MTDSCLIVSSLACIVWRVRFFHLSLSIRKCIRIVNCMVKARKPETDERTVDETSSHVYRVYDGI